MNAAGKNCEQTMCAFSFTAQMQCLDICDIFFACSWIFCHWPSFLVQTDKCIRFHVTFFRHLCLYGEWKMSCSCPCTAWVRLVFVGEEDSSVKLCCFPGKHNCSFLRLKKKTTLVDSKEMHHGNKHAAKFTVFFPTVHAWTYEVNWSASEEKCYVQPLAY